MMKLVLSILASLLLAGYLVFATIWSHEEAENTICRGVEILVSDTANQHFVTASEIAREIDDLPSRADGILLRDINTDDIEQTLRSIDKIERAKVIVMSDNKILVMVDPMVPVARIFDGDHSYYINKEGKRIVADARYHLDVPVISGHFDSIHPAASMLPLIDYIKADKTWNSLVSMISVRDHRNIILVPIIRGHVINIGSLDDLDSKFARLSKFYRDVMPVRGWNYYDTLSVKWKGQLVATRRKKTLPSPQLDFDVESENEVPDVSTMLTTGDTPDIASAKETKKDTTNKAN